MKNTITVAAVMILMGIAMIPSCYGQNIGSDNDMTTDEDLRVFDGIVTNVDVGKSTLTVKGATEVTFPISSDTKILLNTFNDVFDISLSDIKKGNYVDVSYRRSGTDSRVPVKVIQVTVQ